MWRDSRVYNVAINAVSATVPKYLLVLHQNCLVVSRSRGAILGDYLGFRWFEVSVEDRDVSSTL